jgi:hypothetical protein
MVMKIIVFFCKFSFLIGRATIIFQIVYNILSQLSTPPLLIHRLRSERFGVIRILRKFELSVHKVKRSLYVEYIRGSSFEVQDS